jgi:outer membrane lipoprotein-sorting protein
MKTHALRLLASLLLILPLTGVARAQTADDVVEKHLAALGGRDALSKLTSRKSSGTVSVTMSAGVIPGSIETYAKAPNKVRAVTKLDLSAFGAGEMTVEQLFDGTTGYTLNSMNGDAEITGAQLENMRNNQFPSALLHYKDAGATVEILPKEKVGDRDAIVLRVTSKTGSPVRMYLDAETYLPIKTVAKINVPQAGGDVDQTSEYSDYRVVDGVKVPFQIVNANPIQSLTIKLTKVEHNVAIDDAMFVKK